MDIEVKDTYNEQRAKADAIIEKASNDPVGMIKASVTTAAQNLVDNDNVVKQQKEELAQKVVSNAFDQVKATNTKDAKKTYFDLNKNDIEPYGANKDTSKGQQKVLVFGSKFFWVLVMATIGFFYIMPIKTLIELFRGLSFRKIEETTTKNCDTVTIIERKKLGWIGIVVGIILSVVWGAGITYLLVMFPLVFLVVSIVLSIVIGAVVILGDRTKSLKKKNDSKVVIEDVEEV